MILLKYYYFETLRSKLCNTCLKYFFIARIASKIFAWMNFNGAPCTVGVICRRKEMIAADYCNTCLSNDLAELQNVLVSMFPSAYEQNSTPKLESPWRISSKMYRHDEINVTQIAVGLITLIIPLTPRVFYSRFDISFTQISLLKYKCS